MTPDRAAADRRYSRIDWVSGHGSIHDPRTGLLDVRHALHCSCHFRHVLLACAISKCLRDDWAVRPRSKPPLSDWPSQVAAKVASKSVNFGGVGSVQLHHFDQPDGLMSYGAGFNPLTRRGRMLHRESSAGQSSYRRLAVTIRVSAKLGGVCTA
jgi:hypothetical protein